MDSVLIEQVQEAIAGKTSWTGLACESPLRVAASMLARAASYEMSATRVVGTVGVDDQDAFRTLVTEICNEYRLDAQVKVHGGSFTVRFYRP